MDYFNGEILCIDKPLGWTSFDVVKRVRGALQRRLGLKKFKVGHAGTLDPLATGVLLVCTGRATRLIEKLQAGEKEYEATLRLGATTPSFDLETEVDSTSPTDHVTPEMILTELERYRGEVMQTPPAFSAVKVDGRRAYKIARSGRMPELAAKPVVISAIEMTGLQMPDLALRVACSRGTYIRALARDIGSGLGCGAHLTALRRTRVGRHTTAEALSVDDTVALIASAPVELPEWIDPDTRARCLARLEAHTPNT